MKQLLLLLLAGTVAAAPQKTALDRYVAQPDAAYKYSLVRTVPVQGATVYLLRMTSQKWLT